MMGNDDGALSCGFEEKERGDEGYNNIERKKRRKIIPKEEVVPSAQQQQQQPLLDDNCLSIVLTKYSNVLDLENWKSVSKGFDKLCTEAIEKKCPTDKRKKFQSSKELRDAVRKYYNIKYDPRRYRYHGGGENRRRTDAEIIALTYGWIIGLWDVSKITDFSSVFTNLSRFNERIGSWDVSNATNMRCMFDNATSFNQDLSAWVVSSVQNMRFMFDKAATFNQNISGWDTSKVTDMCYMFCCAHSFSQDISIWDTSNVTRLRGMFCNATSLNARQFPWFREQMLSR